MQFNSQLYYLRTSSGNLPDLARPMPQAHVKGHLITASLEAVTHFLQSCCLTAGEELYLIPGIDMMNHTCLRNECNTSLQRSGPAGCVPVAVQAPADPAGTTSAARAVPCFTMHAGEGRSGAHSSLCLTCFKVIWTGACGIL